MRIEELTKRNRFHARCAFYWNLAMQTMVCPQFDPEACEQMGSLCGRLIRFTRTIETPDEGSVELANTTISAVTTEFLKLNDQMREDVASRVSGVLEFAQGTDTAKQDLRDAWGRELEILGILRRDNISDTVDVEQEQAQSPVPNHAIDNKLAASEADCANAIVQLINEQLKMGIEQGKFEFMVRTMALALAGIMSNCRKKRKQFITFMTAAWDEHAATRRKIEATS